MKAVIQRVSRASVKVQGKEVAKIGRGLVVLLGVERDDGKDEIARQGRRLCSRRFFEDSEGKMNLSLLEAGASAVVVSQFTLAADLSKGLRPSFGPAMPPGQAQEMVATFAQAMRSQGIEVQEGVFGARMEVELANDGPVTFIIEEP